MPCVRVALHPPLDLGVALLISTTRSSELPLHVAETIRDSLTKERSDTQRAFQEIVCCMLGSQPADLMPDYPMAIALRTDPYTDQLACIAWASASVWDRSLALQAFVREDYRRKGLATALASALVADGILHPEMPLAVFSDECVRIAQRLGFQQIQRYRICDDGWIRSERLFDDDAERPGSQ